MELLKRIYDRFNARDLDGVLTVLTDDVAWANGMDGGYVHGRGPYASTGRASGAWSVRTSSRWAFIELRMARSSQRSGSPSAISKANRCRGRRTGLETRRSDTFSVFERARWLTSTSRMPFKVAACQSSNPSECKTSCPPYPPKADIADVDSIR